MGNNTQQSLCYSQEIHWQHLCCIWASTPVIITQIPLQSAVNLSSRNSRMYRDRKVKWIVKPQSSNVAKNICGLSSRRMTQMGNFFTSQSCSSPEELFKPEEQWLTEPVKKLNATSGKIFLQKLKFNTPKAFFCVDSRI